jgi:Cysteine-rich secretory protein family
MTRASKLEHYMLTLINHDRAVAGLKPVHLNSDLNTASERHSNWMINRDVFSHQGGGGSTPQERMREAGYQFKGNWAYGENIALQSVRGNPGPWDDVRDLHRMLMNSPEHRANILNPRFDEIGIGLELGSFRLNGNTFKALVVTEDFGRSGTRNSWEAQKAAPEKQAAAVLADKAHVPPAADADQIVLVSATRDMDRIEEDAPQSLTASAANLFHHDEIAAILRPDSMLLTADTGGYDLFG